jgi:hypothetical protein
MKALLHIMAKGDYEGKSLADAEIRALFDPDAMLESDWYAERLAAKAKVDARLWGRHLKSLEAFAANEIYAGEQAKLDIPGRLALARRRLTDTQSPAYLDRLKGTIGADPSVV